MQCLTLLNDYYRIDKQVADGDETLFGITLLPDFIAYKGHFPGNPVSPGVCNIQMIKECAEQLTCKRLFLPYIAKCRFSAVITPLTTPQLQLRMRLIKAETAYHLHATLFDDTTTYIAFKGEFTAINND